jgi:hypothetical protein
VAMFITNMSLPRRTFLRGMGATVALPLLEAMVPALTASAKTVATPPRRFGAVYIPHGAVMNQYRPVTTGAAFEFTPTLKPLEPFREHLAIVSNLYRGGENDHAVACAAWLSGAVPKRTEASDVHLGTTVDQIIAKQIGQETVFPSLELATEDFTGYVGGCSPGYSCSYMNTLSWATPTTPLPTEINPRVVFERLFGRAGTRDQRRLRRHADQSILDSITEEAGDLRRVLGSRDRLRLTQYLDDVRELERRIQHAEAHSGSEVTLDAPIGVPESFEDHVGLMFELMTIAYQADLTRVATFMMAREASNKTYPQIGISDPHHALSHHGDKPEKIAGNVKLNAYHVAQFAKFLDKLRATPDGDGCLLDHTMVAYGSGMSNSNAHSPGPLPLVVLGGGIGKGGRHVETAPKTPLGNLWMTVADAFGASVERIGESTGRVDL